MNTVVLRSIPRRSSGGTSFTIEVLGDSPIKPVLQQAIKELEHHPAKAARRSLIDMLGLIERHNLQIRFTEHATTEDDMESWLFVLQG